MKKILLRAISILSVCIATSSVFAQDLTSDSWINEARLGGHWNQPGFFETGHKERDQSGISAELLFQPVNIDFLGLFEAGPESWTYALVNPRPHLGGLINLDGNGTNYGYGGLTWHFELTDLVFFEGGLGMAYTNGSKTGSATRAALGAKWQFHESVAIGFNVSENLTLVTQFEHLSHRKVFSNYNRGLSSLSVKLGYKF